MQSAKLTVVVRLKAKPGKEDQVREELLKLLTPTRIEQGCINYDMHESLDNPGQFLFHENWTSKAALDSHFQTPHLRRFLGQTDELLAEPPEITLWKMVG